MDHHSLLALAGIVVIGIGVQWIAWRARTPSIILLLLAGFLVGPVTGWLKPDELFGDLLFPGVALAVAVILFEGGLSLNIAELRKIGSALRGLLVTGVLVTWIVSGALAHLVLGFDLALSALLGAILVVTGPTVIIPLLRQVRPNRRVASIVKWEGIVTDPVGAILGVLVFDFIISAGADTTWGVAALAAAKGVGAGALLGLGGAALIVLLLKQFWVPDFLRSHVTLAVVLGVYSLSNLALAEAGLLAVTVMGSALASQKLVRVRRIVQFKENLRVLLISVLFIVLAARLPLTDPAYFDPRSILFLAALILVQRPLSVLLGTAGSDLTWREKAFICFLAPRGIVVAAVGTVFAFELVDLNFAGSEQFGPIVFLTIIVTVAFYGVVAGPLARRLGLAVAKPQGVLFVGASPWVRRVAETLQRRKVAVLLVDANWQNVTEARRAGLPAHYGNILDEDVLDELDLDGIGHCVMATRNDEVNTLAADHMREVFDQSAIFQVVPAERTGIGDRAEVPMHMQGRRIGTADATWQRIAALFEAGATVKQTNLTGEFTYHKFQEHYHGNAIPLFAIGDSGTVEVMEVARKRPARGASVIISIAPSEPASEVA